MTMRFKYSFEADLQVENEETVLIPASSLSEFDNDDFPEFHIYAVLTYPKVYLDESSVDFTETHMHVDLFSIEEGEKKSKKNPIPFLAMPEQFKSVSIPYPGEKIVIEMKSGQKIEYSSQEFFMTSMGAYDKTPRFEILYIGQAFAKGTRNAIGRLQSHSTLQEILSRCSTEYSDKHIYIMLFKIKAHLGMGFNGIDKEFKKTEEESQAHMEAVIKAETKEEQVINITEAALIHYFKPSYNVTFKNNFPKKTHTSYKDYYDLDYSSYEFIFNPIEFAGARVKIFTSTNDCPSPYRPIHYRLENDDSRKTMYDIFKPNPTLHSQD